MIDLSRIKAFVFDIDGVMTDGGITCVAGGDLYRTYNAKDCFAVRMAVMNGYQVGVITGGRSHTIIDRFAGSCKVPESNIYLNCRDKMIEFRAFCKAHSLDASEVMYFGDDIPDISVLKACGAGVCPCDAVDDVKDASDIISDYPGGRGCVREAIERTMRLQGKWIFDAGVYEKTY